MAENEYNEQRQMQQPALAQQQFTQAVSLAGRRVSEASSIDDGSMIAPVLPPPPGYQQQQQQAVASQLESSGVQLAPISTAVTAGGSGRLSTPETPRLSPDDASFLAAGAAADMNLGLLGSPEALSGLAAAAESSGALPASTSGCVGSGSSGKSSVAGAEGGLLGPPAEQRQQQTLMQLVSAEEVSVSFPQGGGCDSSNTSDLAQQQQQHGGLQEVPAVVVELQQQHGKKLEKDGMVAAGNGMLDLKKQHCGVRSVLGEEECHQGGSSSPAEAEVIVVDGSGRQQQQGRGSHLGSQHASLLAKLGV
jgi:hypothetical protein